MARGSTRHTRHPRYAVRHLNSCCLSTLIDPRDASPRLASPQVEDGERVEDIVLRSSNINLAPNCIPHLILHFSPRHYPRPTSTRQPASSPSPSPSSHPLVRVIEPYDSEDQTHASSSPSPLCGQRTFLRSSLHPNSTPTTTSEEDEMGTEYDVAGYHITPSSQSSILNPHCSILNPQRE